jgi:tRNA (adenine22-N1)-methyltransferase
MDRNNSMDVCLKMSKRLLTVADMLGGYESDISFKGANVSYGHMDRFRRVADVGCDHGYVSIYLLQKGIADAAIAMDVRSGPLSMAEGHIREYGLSDRIETRLSDGLGELKEGEADGLVIAGMGGKLMMSILDAKDLRTLGIKVAVLQPQSDIPLFREYLRNKGYCTLDERIVFEDGKYYFPMRVVIPSESGEGAGGATSSFSQRICDRFGLCNIQRKDELLKDYLEHGREVAQSVLSSLDEEQHRERYREVRDELDDIEEVLEYFTAK